MPSFTGLPSSDTDLLTRSAFAFMVFLPQNSTAVSSTWGFPYDTPDWCEKCYDCDDPKCACTFSPGFCQMLRQGDTAMYIDSVRVYQSDDDKAHVGNEHTLGCDPPEYPTRDYIVGHEYRYMRNPPFSYLDKHPMRPVQKGGGECNSDEDCGSHVRHVNLTEVFLNESKATSSDDGSSDTPLGRGQCISQTKWFGSTSSSKVCTCNDGFTGPHCLSLDHIDESPSAHNIRMSISPFSKFERFYLTPFMMFIIGVMAPALIAVLIFTVATKKKQKQVPVHLNPMPGANKGTQGRTNDVVAAERVPLTTRRSDHLSITGRSI